MILTCPACSTRFNVAMTALGAGRQVRCAKCRHTWFAEAPPGVAPASAATVAEPLRGTPPESPPIGLVTDESLDIELRPIAAEAPDEPARAAAPRHPAAPAPARPRWVLGGWAALAAAIVLLLAGLGLGRGWLVDSWPRMARLYALVGLAGEPPGAGLAFRQVSSARRDENGKPALVVEGEVANVSAMPRPVPDLVVVLEDGEGRAVQRWTVEPPRRELAPGGAATFRATIPGPSAAAARVVVTVAGGA
jgi:predicted Zn finger-like uncharacterized protein